MSTAAQLKYLLAQFQQWNQQFPGVTSIAADLDDALVQLQQHNKPGAARTVIVFHREEKRGQFEESGMVDRYFWVIISVGKGMKADRSAALTEGQAGGKALYDVTDSARDDVIRKLNFDAIVTEVTPDYRGMEPLTVNNVTFTDAQRLEFSIGTQLPAAQ